MTSDYKMIVLNSGQSSIETVSYALFTLILSSLSIRNSSRIQLQNSLFNLDLSNASIIDSIISDVEAVEPAIKVTSSIFDIVNTSISTISGPDNYEFMLITIDSTLSINNLTFDDSNSNLFNSRSATIMIDGLIIRNVTSFTNLIKISSSNYINISRCGSISTNTSIDEQILITGSSSVRIIGLDVSDTPELIIDIVNSNVTTISNLKIHN